MGAGFAGYGVVANYFAANSPRSLIGQNPSQPQTAELSRLRLDEQIHSRWSSIEHMKVDELRPNPLKDALDAACCDSRICS